jgi:hypothetical protein
MQPKEYLQLAEDAARMAKRIETGGAPPHAPLAARLATSIPPRAWRQYISGNSRRTIEALRSAQAAAPAEAVPHFQAAARELVWIAGWIATQQARRALGRERGKARLAELKDWLREFHAARRPS